MGSIGDALAGCTDWSEPRLIGSNPFRLSCRLAPAATQEEIAEAWGSADLPAEVSELWLTCREAELCVDADYRQWGLKLLSPRESAARSELERSERPDDLGPGDIVLGEFLGDQELLVVDPDGRPLVALPLDNRDEWYRPGADLSEFLRRYVAAAGEKYWEA
jgi:hypothetical protein